MTKKKAPKKTQKWTMAKIEKIAKPFPGADVQKDNNGQVIIYTGLYEGDNGITPHAHEHCEA